MNARLIGPSAKMVSDMKVGCTMTQCPRVLRIHDAPHRTRVHGRHGQRCHDHVRALLDDVPKCVLYAKMIAHIALDYSKIFDEVRDVARFAEAELDLAQPLSRARSDRSEAVRAQSQRESRSIAYVRQGLHLHSRS